MNRILQLRPGATSATAAVARKLRSAPTSSLVLYHQRHLQQSLKQDQDRITRTSASGSSRALFSSLAHCNKTSSIIITPPRISIIKNSSNTKTRSTLEVHNVVLSRHRAQCYNDYARVKEVAARSEYIARIFDNPVFVRLKNLVYRFYKILFAILIAISSIAMLYLAYQRCLFATLRKYILMVYRLITTMYDGLIIILDYKYSLRNYEAGSEELAIARRKVHQRSADRLLALCHKHGGIYIKAGQIIASMNHILPREYTQTLAPCQDRAKFISYEEIKEIFEKEFGAPLTYFFSQFSESPIAAASLAQVHHGRTIDGQEVAVKVQFPSIEHFLHSDTFTIQCCIKMVEMFFPGLNLMWLVREMKDNLPKELDFIQEGKNSERTARNFANSDYVTTPKIIWKATSSKVLTMEFIHGVKVNDLDALKAIGANPAKVSKMLSKCFSEQMFIHGFVHCDPHPGNVLVRRNRTTRNIELVLLDHGLYKELDDEFRLDYCTLWKSMILKEEDEFRRICEKLGVRQGRYKLLYSMLTLRSFDRSKAGVQNEKSSIESMELRKFGYENINTITDVLATIPPQMLLLFKCHDMLGSVQRDLKLPLNYFVIMGQHAMKGLILHRQMTHPGLISWVQGVRDSLMMTLRLKAIALLVRVASWVSWFWGPTTTTSAVQPATTPSEPLLTPPENQYRLSASFTYNMDRAIVLNSSNFSYFVLNPEKNVLVQFYDPTELSTEVLVAYDEVARELGAEKRDLIVAMVDISAFDDIAQRYGGINKDSPFHGPVIKLFTKTNKEGILYSSPYFTKQALKNFIEENGV